MSTYKNDNIHVEKILGAQWGNTSITNPTRTFYVDKKVGIEYIIRLLFSLFEAVDDKNLFYQINLYTSNSQINIH